MKIFILENDIVLFKVMVEVFSCYGHHISSVMSYKDAFDQLGKESFDLIIINIRKDKDYESGLDTYHLIRSQWENVPVVVLISDYNLETYNEIKMFLGADPYHKIFMKPISVQTLEDIMDFASKTSEERGGA